MTMAACAGRQEGPCCPELRCVSDRCGAQQTVLCRQHGAHFAAWLKASISACVSSVTAHPGKCVGHTWHFTARPGSGCIEPASLRIHSSASSRLHTRKR